MMSRIASITMFGDFTTSAKEGMYIVCMYMYVNLSVSRITQNLKNRFPQNLAGGDGSRPRLATLTFSAYPDKGMV